MIDTWGYIMSYVSDNELEEIKRRKLLEYQRQIAQRREEEERRRIEEAKRAEILRRILTPKARERLANLKMVRPEFVRYLEEQLIMLSSSNRISLPITDDMLRSILASLNKRARKEIKIKGLYFKK